MKSYIILKCSSHSSKNKCIKSTKYNYNESDIKMKYNGNWYVLWLLCTHYSYYIFKTTILTKLFSFFIKLSTYEYVYTIFYIYKRENLKLFMTQIYIT